MKSAGVAHPKAFTIGFNEPRFNEAPAAAKIAERLGIDHVVEMLDVNDLLSLLPEYIEQFDEPFADSSAFPTMALARLARRHVTVALSGDGADELFGGYHYYPLMARISPVMSWRGPWRAAFRGRAHASRPSRQASRGALDSGGNIALFNYLRSSGKHFPPSSATMPAFDVGLRKLVRAVRRRIRRRPARRGDGYAIRRGHYAARPFLQKVDVATMAFSLEARCPDDGLSAGRMGDAIAGAIQDTGRTDQVSLEEGVVQASSRGARISAEDGVRRTDRQLAAGDPCGNGRNL